MTPDEIVRALKCCSRVDAQCNGCDGCPLEYCGPECDLLCKNAATLIESLQADLRHEEIENAPTVFQVKHGHWNDEDTAHNAYCSYCGKINKVSKYCPSCGARMDG